MGHLGRERLRSTVAFIATAVLVFALVFRLVPMTPRGVQCPTAAVQTVLVAQRDCCDRVVGYEARKPQEGEQGFKQCRCAETRAATHDDATTDSRFAMPMIATARLVVSLPLRMAEASVSSSGPARLQEVPSAPPLRPPLA